MVESEYTLDRIRWPDVWLESVEINAKLVQIRTSKRLLDKRDVIRRLCGWRGRVGDYDRVSGIVVAVGVQLGVVGISNVSIGGKNENVGPL